MAGMANMFLIHASPGAGVRVSVIECFEFLKSEDGYKGCRSCRVDGGTCVRQLNIWNASG
jgi:hypothetical protein